MHLSLTRAGAVFAHHGTAARAHAHMGPINTWLASMGATRAERGWILLIVIALILIGLFFVARGLGFGRR